MASTPASPAASAEAEFAAQKDATQAVKSGSALLDLFLDNLGEMARRGTPADVEKRLQEMMAAARKAREANLIDPVFFVRYNRMLAVTKLVITPDSGGILAPVIDDVLSGFVLDKLGHRGFDAVSDKGPKAVNYVAQALSVELINLQIYLDTAKERTDLEHKIQVRMSGAPKK